MQCEQPRTGGVVAQRKGRVHEGHVAPRKDNRRLAEGVEAGEARVLDQEVDVAHDHRAAGQAALLREFDACAISRHRLAQEVACTLPL